jgi:hypothetical protein
VFFTSLKIDISGGTAERVGLKLIPSSSLLFFRFDGVDIALCANPLRLGCGNVA